MEQKEQITGTSGLRPPPTFSPESTSAIRNSATSPSSSPQKGPVEVIEVTNRSQLKQFLALTAKIYAHTPRYVHPLGLHMKMMMGKLVAPNKKFFIAKVNGETVARLGVKVHEH